MVVPAFTNTVVSKGKIKSKGKGAGASDKEKVSSDARGRGRPKGRGKKRAADDDHDHDSGGNDEVGGGGGGDAATDTTVGSTAEAGAAAGAAADAAADAATAAAAKFRCFSADAPWLPLVRAILGPDAALIHTGCILSLPGSVAQPWHSDGDHLDPHSQLPPHCLNVSAHGPIILHNITTPFGTGVFTFKKWLRRGCLVPMRCGAVRALSTSLSLEICFIGKPCHCRLCPSCPCAGVCATGGHGRRGWAHRVHARHAPPVESPPRERGRDRSRRLRHPIRLPPEVNWPCCCCCEASECASYL